MGYVKKILFILYKAIDVYYICIIRIHLHNIFKTNTRILGLIAFQWFDYMEIEVLKIDSIPRGLDIDLK